MGKTFFIVSPKHTIPSHRYITFWRANRSGYCWPLSWAGTYDEAEARAIDRDDAFAVPVSAVLALTEPPVSGDIDGNAGPVVMRTKANMAALRMSRLQPAEAPPAQTGQDK
jgi:hypothetical protein